MLLFTCYIYEFARELPLMCSWLFLFVCVGGGHSDIEWLTVVRMVFIGSFDVQFPVCNILASVPVAVSSPQTGCHVCNGSSLIRVSLNTFLGEIVMKS